jgi:Holliday junction resolvase RusA-like endonuclease
VIIGKVPPKSNCYRIIILKNKDKSKQHASLAKAKELKKYEQDFYIQCMKYRNVNISNDFEIEVDVYFERKRSDLDNSLKVILDCLQSCKAIANDNLCIKIVARKFVDASNPRIEFELKEVQL